MKKRSYTQLRKISLQWLCLVAMMLLGCLTEAQANTANFYYNATVTPSPIGGGKVYVRTNRNDQIVYQSQEYSTGKQKQFSVNYGQTTLYLNAQSNSGWLFSKWTNSRGETLSNSSDYNPEIIFDGSSSSPTQFRYTAVFVKQEGYIKVQSEDESKGTVDISNPNNVVNDVVTLTATPDVANGVMFLGWTKDDGTEFKDNPMTLTVTTETAGTYTAHFSDKSEQFYVRIQNKQTGRFISFYGDVTAQPHTRTSNGRTVQDGFIFTNSLKMIDADNAQGNPETVFLKQGHTQATGLTIGNDLVVFSDSKTNTQVHSTQYSGLVSGNPANGTRMLTIQKSGNDTYRIYTNFKYNIPLQGDVEFNSYFFDEGSDYLVMKALETTELNSDAAEWYVYVLNENTTEGAFGANAKAPFTKEGKYYTTMYTDFPYECLDGVNAYYLDTEDNLQKLQNGGRVVYFTEVPNGKVPAHMAVVLECNVVQNDFTENKTVVNRLLPLLKSEGPNEIITEGAHFLKGYVSVNNSSVTNDKSIMYVLSSLNGRLGFYHSSKATMTPNKAYLNTRVSPDDYPDAPAVTFSFGKEEAGETNSITTHEVVVNDEDAPVYDLQGRKMTGPLPAGIYVTKGRLFLVK